MKIKQDRLNPMTDSSLSVERLVSLLLGHSGRMIAGSKSTYLRAFPKNLVMFNANVILEGMGKVWHGDLDITRDEALLVRLAELTDRELYVLYEMDGRFENEDSPKLDRAAYKVSKVPFLSWHIFIGESKLEDWYVRHRRSGIIQQKPTPRKSKPKTGSPERAEGERRKEPSQGNS